jgi:hypothetical protein
MGKPKNDRPNGLELVSPEGEVFAAGDLDSVIRGWRAAMEKVKEWRAFASTLASLIGSYAEKPADALNTRTTRLAGDEEKVKLIWPTPNFDQKALRTIWADWPKQSRDYLAIGSIRVRLREYKKLVKTTAGTALFRKFRSEMLAAQVQYDPMPRVQLDFPTKPSTSGEGLAFYDRAEDMRTDDEELNDADAPW